MDYRIWKIINFVKGTVSANYMEVKQRQNRTRQQRSKYLRQQDINDKRERIAQDFALTAYMIGIKDRLDKIFFNDPTVNFAHVIENVSNSMPDGAFSNSIVVD